MSGVSGKIELQLTAEEASVEDVRTLLQAIRDWETKRKMGIFVGVFAPWMTDEDSKFIFDNIKPPFKR